MGPFLFRFFFFFLPSSFSSASSGTVESVVPERSWDNVSSIAEEKLDTHAGTVGSEGSEMARRFSAQMCRTLNSQNAQQRKAKKETKKQTEDRISN